MSRIIKNKARGGENRFTVFAFATARVAATNGDRLRSIRFIFIQLNHLDQQYQANC